MGRSVIYSFDESLKVGELGEDKILRFLQEQDGVVDVLDLRNSKTAQRKDIDFLVKTNDFRFTVELKTDTYRSGNFFFETVSAIETRSLGWTLKSRANLLAYYFIKTDTLYLLQMSDIRAIVKDDTFQVYKKTVKNRFSNGIYTSEGLAVPIRCILERVQYRKYLLKNF